MLSISGLEIVNPAALQQTENKIEKNPFRCVPDGPEGWLTYILTRFHRDWFNILAANSTAFKKLQKFLNEKILDFLTFTLSQEPNWRRIHHLTDVHNANKLKSHGLEPTYMMLLPRRINGSRISINIFFVKVKKSVQWEKIKGISRFIEVRVTLDTFHPPWGDCYEVRRSTWSLVMRSPSKTSRNA